MTAIDVRPAPAPPERRVGRRKSDRAQLPEWLDAPLIDGNEPRDGDLVDAHEIRVGDYLLEFHESDGTASWLRVQSAVMRGDAAHVTYGRGGGITVEFGSDRQVWVLDAGGAAVLAHAASDRLVRAWGGLEVAMRDFLRGFATREALVGGWPYESPSLADAVTAWDLLREADVANTTDVPATAGAVAR